MLCLPMPAEPYSFRGRLVRLDWELIVDFPLVEVVVSLVLSPSRATIELQPEDPTREITQSSASPSRTVSHDPDDIPTLKPLARSRSRWAGAELRAAIRDYDCGALSADLRIAAEPLKRYFYADAIVVCGPVSYEGDTTDVLTNPSVVVEVLSPSTEAYDRGVKGQAYRRLPSLTDYLLVSQAEPRIEHYRRDPDGSWRFFEYEAGDRITLANGARLAVDAVYEGAFRYDAS